MPAGVVEPLHSAAFLGLGEAGSAIARDLVRAGVSVSGFDPAGSSVDGVDPSDSAGEAVSGVQLVVSLNSARASVGAARAVAAALAPGQLYADANAASAGVKREVEATVGPSGALFADLALLGPVPGNGVRTPALVSGPGADRVVELLAPLGMPVESVGPETGAAAARKLVRSVFMKGLAAAAAESVAAGREAGCQDWILAEIDAVLARPQPGLLQRLLEGSAAHALRRADELAACVELLDELGVEPRIAAATREWLEELARDREPAHG